MEQVGDDVARCRDRERGQGKGGIKPVADEGYLDEPLLPDPEIFWEDYKRELEQEIKKEYVAADHAFIVDYGGHEFAMRNTGVSPDNGQAVFEALIKAFAIFLTLQEQAAETKKAEDDLKKAALVHDAEVARKKEEEAKKTPAEEPTEEEKEEQQCLSDAKCNEPDGTEPTKGMPAPDGEFMTCDDIERRWEFFKAYCDLSSWQNYRCQQFLRVANGCVDASRILPGPDGDLTCPDRSDRSDAEARRIDCERRKGVWLASGYGDNSCRPRDAAVSVTFDACNDPRAEWLPDQCLPGGSVDGEPRPAPSPVARPAPNPVDFGLMIAGPKMPTGLVPPSSLRAMSDDNFDSALESSQPILVAFVASGCAPCHRTLSHLEQGNQTYGDRLGICQVDVTQNMKLQKRFGITHTPTLILFDKGEPLGYRRVGAATRERLFAWIDTTLKQPSPTALEARRPSEK